MTNYPVDRTIGHKYRRIDGECHAVLKIISLPNDEYIGCEVIETDGMMYELGEILCPVDPEWNPAMWERVIDKSEHFNHLYGKLSSGPEMA